MSKHGDVELGDGAVDVWLFFSSLTARFRQCSLVVLVDLESAVLCFSVAMLILRPLREGVLR
ncbi:hypothetical protein PSEUDO8Z_60538 [Pseudomonas sp. 8Z]|nr:hypothetical protein PSEUDO8Z_60538 [Pseudomonas sp. 8Z]